MRSIASNLRDLLVKARDLKQSNDIDPPLHFPEFETGVISITHPSYDLGDGSADLSTIAEPQYAAFENSARDIFYEQLAAFAEDEATFVDICNLLDILQFCADKRQCDSSLPLWLVEELLESQTIEGCKRVFDYLESRRERMITNTFHKNKQMIVLRSCNELLRRLSRAEDAVFCGRVFMFLFQSFPLGDKSSVNLRGEFHVENTTTFDAPETKSEIAEGEDKMDVDEKVKAEDQAVQSVDETTAVENEVEIKIQTNDIPKPVIAEDSSRKENEHHDTNALYSTFWSLQTVFSNPTKIFITEEFKAFKKGLEATLQKFKSVTKVLQTHGTSRTAKDGRKGTKRKRGRDHDEFASTFNPKYLTSSDLFELEMNDLTFQRHILVQALILIDFLLSLTPKSKKKLADLKAQKAMVYQYTLSPEDTTWATATRLAISTYLQEAPEGKFYYRMIDNVLSRDKNWVRWKIESCPPISLPPIPTSSYAAALNGAKRACIPRRLRATPMGSMDLSFLTEETGKEVAEKRLSLLREPQRYKIPGTEGYLKDIQGVDLDVEMLVEEEAREKEKEKEKEEEEEKKTEDPENEKERETESTKQKEIGRQRKKETERLMAIRASKTWRVLRMAAKTRLRVLGEVDEKKNMAILDTTSGDNGEGDVEELAEDEKGDQKTDGANLTPAATVENETVPDATIQNETTSTTGGVEGNNTTSSSQTEAISTAETLQADTEMGGQNGELKESVSAMEDVEEAIAETTAAADKDDTSPKSETAIAQPLDEAFAIASGDDTR